MKRASKVGEVVAEPCVNGADVDCPPEVLAAGEARVGTKQNNNLYVTGADGVEHYIGVLFRAAYGRVIVERLERGRE